MRNVRKRIPFEQYAFSQTTRVRKQQFQIANKIGVEEDKYLDDMNQFYLDYQKFENTKTVVNKLQQFQNIFDKGRIMKSSIKRVYLDQLKSREKMANHLLNMPLFDNLQLQKDVISAESELAKYQKALQEHMSISYILNEHDINNLYIDNLDTYLFRRKESINSYQSSLSNKILNNKCYKQIQENILNRRKIKLNIRLNQINSKIAQIQNVVEAINSDCLHENDSVINTSDLKLSDVIVSDLTEKRKNHLNAMFQQINKEEEEVKNNEIQCQLKYSELGQHYQTLLTKSNSINLLVSKLLSIQEEKIKNKKILFEKENEYFELVRQLNQQKASIRFMNTKIAEKKNDLFELKSQLFQKQNKMQRKARNTQSLIKNIDNMEDELDIKCKVMDLKLKNLNFAHNRIESRKIGVPSPRRPRLLRLDNLRVNQKSRSLKKDENLVSNEF